MLSRAIDNATNGDYIFEQMESSFSTACRSIFSALDGDCLALTAERSALAKSVRTGPSFDVATAKLVSKERAKSF